MYPLVNFSLRQTFIVYLLLFVIFLPIHAPLVSKQAPIIAASIEKKPHHIAIIMDGNGRWGKAKYGDRSCGHRHAKEAVKEVIEACVQQGISYLTLYAFSTENWGRPAQEVAKIFQSITQGVEENLHSFMEHNIKLRIIGNQDGLPPYTCLKLNKAMQATKLNNGLNLTVAINYGGKVEAIAASQAIARASLHEAVQQFQAELHSIGNLSFDDFIRFLDAYAPKVSVEMYEKHLYTSGLPPVDLLIRTGRRKRLSNFLPWQSAYAEVYFMDLLWPDFRKSNLLKALDFFYQQQRTFGTISK